MLLLLPNMRAISHPVLMQTSLLKLTTLSGIGGRVITPLANV
jgi:hypothetical protein